MASARNQNAWANHNPATSAQALHSVSPTSLYPPSNSRNGPSSNPPLAYPQLSMPSFMTENTEYSTPSVVPGDRERMACHRSILEREEMLQSRPVNIDDYIKDLRRATLRVVEEVTAWRKCLNSSAPSLSLPSILSEGEGHLYPRKGSSSLPYLWKGQNYLLKLIRDLDNFPTYFLPVGVSSSRNPFMLLLNLDTMFRSPSTLSDMLVDGDAISSVEMLRMRRACGVILAEEAQYKDTANAASNQMPTRGRSRKARRGNDDKTFFLPSRLSQSPYASSEDRSRSASRKRSQSPYELSVANIAEERPSTTPAKMRSSKQTRIKRRQRSRPSSASSHAKDNDPPTVGIGEAFQAPPPTNTLFNVSHNVMQMRKELEEMSTMLLQRGIIDQNPLQTTSDFTAGATVSIIRPQTSPLPNRPQQRDPFASPSTIYIMDHAKVSDQMCILKFLLGPKDKDPKHYEDIFAMPIRVEGWDRRRRRRIQPIMISSIDCDRIVGFCPNEIMNMGDEDKKNRCNRIVKVLALKSMPSELEEWESEEEEEVETPLHDPDDEDSVLSEGSAATRPTRTVRQKVVVTKRKEVKRFQLQLARVLQPQVVNRTHVLLNKIKCDMEVTYKGGENNSLVLSVWKTKNRNVNDRSKLVFTRRELKVLLGNQHALYLRSNYKFSSMKAVGEMLMDRVDTITDWTSSSPTLNLIFNRSVSLPERFSGAGIMGRQEGDSLIMEGGGKLASLGLDEVEAMHSGIKKTEEDAGHRPQKGFAHPLGEVLGKVKVTGTSGGLEVDRKIYNTTITIAGGLHKIGVSVLPNREYLFETEGIVSGMLAGGSAAIDGKSSEPLVLSLENCKKIIEEKEDQDYFHASIWKSKNATDMVKRIIKHLVFVSPPEPEGPGETTSKLPLLQSPLYKNVKSLRITLNDTGIVIGSVDIDNHCTLSDLRMKITEEIDTKELPPNFRIVYKNAPTSKSQEQKRLAFDLLPMVTLKCKELPEKVRQVIEGEMREKMEEAIRRAQFEKTDAVGAVVEESGGGKARKKKRQIGKKRKKSVAASASSPGGTVTIGGPQTPVLFIPGQTGQMSPAAISLSGSPSTITAAANAAARAAGAVAGVGFKANLLQEEGGMFLESDGSRSPDNNRLVGLQVGGLQAVHKNLLKSNRASDRTGCSSPTVSILKNAAAGGSPGSEASHGSKVKSRTRSGRVPSPDSASHDSRHSIRSGSTRKTDRSPSPTHGIPKKLSIMAGVAGVGGGAMSPLNALKAKRQTLQTMKNRKSLALKKEAAAAAEEEKPEFAAFPIEATVTVVQGNCYVKSSKDLTKILEPGMRVRIGAPDGQDWYLSECLAPHVIKEIEAGRVRREEDRRVAEVEMMQAEDVNVAEAKREKEGWEEGLPDEVLEEMKRQKELIRGLQKQITSLQDEGKEKKDEEEKKDGGAENDNSTQQALSSENRGACPPIESLEGNIFTPHYFTISQEFDFYRAKPGAAKKGSTGGSKMSLLIGAAGGKKTLVQHRGRGRSGRGTNLVGSPKSSPKNRPKSPIFRRPEQLGQSPVRRERSPSPTPQGGEFGNSFSTINKKFGGKKDLSNLLALTKAGKNEPQPEDGDEIKDLRIWKVIPKEADERQKWMVAFDNLEVPYARDFIGSKSEERHFNVGINWSILEEWCKDIWPPIEKEESKQGEDWGFSIDHQQRATHFPQLPLNSIIEQAFQATCATQPPTPELDGTKWAKFIRDIELFPESMKRKANTHIDLAFTRQVAKNKHGKSGGRGANRVIDIEGFTFALMEVANLRYPEYDDDEKATREVLFEYVVMIPDINKRCWREAKTNAMKQEAIIQCAAIRTQTEIRRKVVFEEYKRKRNGCILIQKWGRSRLYLKAHEERNVVLDMDRAVRRRAKLAEERRKRAEYRKKHRKQREERERAVLHREATNINGTLVNIMWKKKDARSCSLDMTVIMVVYVPTTSASFVFEISEGEMRYFAEREAVKTGGRVSYGEVMEVANLVKLKTRLKCRVVKRPDKKPYPTFKYSRKVQSERGVIMMSRGFNIAHMAVDRKKNVLVAMKGSLYIATAYRSTEAITFLAYDPKSSKNLRASVTTNMLAVWIRKEETSKIKRANNAKRQKVADAVKILGLYKIGVKYPEEEIYECIDAIQAWLEVRRKDGVSVVPLRKVEKKEAEKGDKRQKMKKLTSRQIQLAAITDGGEGDDDDEDEEVMMSTAMVLKQEARSLEGSEVDLLSMGAAVADDVIGGENPQEAEEVVEEGPEERVEVPSDCEMPLADILGNTEEETFLDQEPFLLRPGNEAELVLFLLKNLNVFIGTKKGSKIQYSKRHVLMFPHDIQGVVRELSAEKLQGLWRMRQARKYIKELLISRFEKRFDRSTATYYYIDPRPNCRLVFTKKPIGLGKDDLDDPVDEWIMDQDEEGKKMWFNPKYGMSSYLSQNQNAKMIQKCVKAHQAAALGSPTLGEMIRAIKFQREAAERYAEFPDKLSSVVNYALLQHTHEFDLDLAKMLYQDAMIMSPENPVLLRAYGLFRMMSCEVPREQTVEKCNEMFRSAYIRDQEGEKFHICQDAFFHFSVVQMPQHRLALLNYALVNQCIENKYELADRLYRMALRFAPNDKLVNRNYADFQEQQLPGGMYFKEEIGPNGTVEQRSEVHEEKEEWGEWIIKMDKQVKDPRFKKFWFNKLTNKTRWIPPNWDEVWRNRVKRSVEIRQLGNFKEWYDQKLDLTFYQDVEFEKAQDAEKGIGLGLGVFVEGGEQEEKEEAGEVEFMIVNPFGDDDE